MEVMKVLMEKTVSERLTLINRVRKFFGMRYNANISLDSKTTAKISYDMADAMIEQRGKAWEERV